MTTFKVTFFLGPVGSRERIDVYAEIPEPELLGGFEIQMVEDDGSEMPVVVQSFPRRQGMEGGNFG